MRLVLSFSFVFGILLLLVTQTLLKFRMFLCVGGGFSSWIWECFLLFGFVKLK
jgi:hypothetical protein